MEENLILKATLQELNDFRDNMTVSMLHQEKVKIPMLYLIKEDIRYKICDCGRLIMKSNFYAYKMTHLPEMSKILHKLVPPKLIFICMSNCEHQ